jgi:hypothetical protein
MESARDGCASPRHCGATRHFASSFLIAFVFDRWFAAAAGGSRAGHARRPLPAGRHAAALRAPLRLARCCSCRDLTALSQFAGLGRIAGSFLASGALVAAIVGFAARQTLANLVAGIMLAMTQPLRVGDWVTFEEHYGVVEDVRLNYTLLRALGDQRIVIPNERLAGGILRNDTLETGVVGLDVSSGCRGADVRRAVDALREDRAGRDDRRERRRGTRLAIGDERVPPAERASARPSCASSAMRRLRAEGVLGD